MNSKTYFVLILVLICSLFALLKTAAELTNDNPTATIIMTNEDGSITNREFVSKTTNFQEFATFLATNMESIHSQRTAIQTNVSIVDKRWVAPATNFPTWITNAAFLTEVHEIGVPAEIYLNDLREHGRLPGISQSSHGDIFLDESGFSNYLDSQKITYPCSLTFIVVLKEEPLTNHYTVITPIKNSKWHLQRAWQTDPEGNVLTEWPVK